MSCIWSVDFFVKDEEAENPEKNYRTRQGRQPTRSLDREATLSQLSHPCFSIVMKHQSRYEEKYAYRFPFATVPVATVCADHVNSQGKARTDSNVSNVWNCDLRNTSINNRLVRRFDPADQCIGLQFETNFRLNCKAKNKG